MESELNPKLSGNFEDGPPVVVVGAGVIGLSAAYRLALAGYRVTIVARDFPQPFETTDARAQINYTSLWAGAHNRWVLPANDQDLDGKHDHGFALQTFAHMEGLLSSHGSETGIAFTPGVEYLEAPVAAVYKSLTEDKANKELGIQDFRLIDHTELPDGVAWGCIGFGDPAVFPTRGQTVLVAENCSATITRQNGDGTWTFCVPRPCAGGTVIGGTKQPDDWSLDADPEIRKKLLDSFAKTYPRMFANGKAPRVLRDIVGRRPTRKGGMRLEKEMLSHDCRVIHAYGLGGRGYELSWGVAEAVLKFVEL